MLALVSRPSAVDLSSFSPGTVALVVGLTLSFLAPIAVALLLTTDGRKAGNERTMADGRSTGGKRVMEGRDATGTRNGSPSATRIERSAGVRRERTRTPDGSER